MNPILTALLTFAGAAAGAWLGVRHEDRRWARTWSQLAPGPISTTPPDFTELQGADWIVEPAEAASQKR